MCAASAPFLLGTGPIYKPETCFAKQIFAGKVAEKTTQDVYIFKQSRRFAAPSDWYNPVLEKQSSSNRLALGWDRN